MGAEKWHRYAQRPGFSVYFIRSSRITSRIKMSFKAWVTPAVPMITLWRASLFISVHILQRLNLFSDTDDYVLLWYNSVRLYSFNIGLTPWQKRSAWFCLAKQNLVYYCLKYNKIRIIYYLHVAIYQLSVYNGTQNFPRSVTASGIFCV